MTDELHFAQACVGAATHLHTTADELAANPDDPDAVGKAGRDTLTALEQLAGMHPPAPILASLQRIATDLSTAGARTTDKTPDDQMPDTARGDQVPDKARGHQMLDTIRGAADAIGQIAQDYARQHAKGQGTWQ
ncbi:hypothetical protein [Mycolicibacterium alvei]|uniref:Uncharacterized protein n=1 Tax=Mycolicibacterium alvei TaxID=67081 RepID=A0A6N4V2M1_9MYCO|nr:hypothetical protein [Mycolicibacterium alvei]MCV7003511.1 hypothetical protein [Mycolicibacterium alvei]BBX30535.1 hypothetical protein MALV_56600 [Mycolicibacterium alvei]